jgi:peptide/nickel transport system ATP-binding protein
MQAQILELLERLRAELGLALILISHDLSVLAETCDRIAVMYAPRRCARRRRRCARSRPRSGALPLRALGALAGARGGRGGAPG